MSVREQSGSVWVTEIRGQWIAAYRHVRQDGSLVLAEVRVFPREREDDDIGDAAREGLWSGRVDVVPSGGMVARLLKELRPGEATRKARGPSGMSFQLDAAIITKDQDAAVAGSGTPGGAGALPLLTVEQRLARVAVHYVLAHRSGSRRTNKDVAARLGVPVSKVTEDLRAARRKGILERPPSQGQVHGDLTDKGNEVLEELVYSRLEHLEAALLATWGGPEVRTEADGDEARSRLLAALDWLGIDWVDVQLVEPDADEPDSARLTLVAAWGDFDA